MKLFLYVFIIHLFTHGHCSSDIHIGYRVTLSVPTEYTTGFVGRAFIMETNQTVPNFKVGLSIESSEQKQYSCSLDVFLGDVRVWSSAHFSRFYTTEKCMLELMQNGDLQLMGQKERAGWRTGTSGQGVQRLHLLGTGNLVLVDALNLIKWQSFNFPANIMLWGQRLNVATRLTSFPSNSTSFFSFEIQQDRIALYLNSGKLKYSYWDFRPSENQNITFIEVGTKGLEFFGDKYTKIDQILPSRGLEPLRFLALGSETGNLGLYYYSPDKGKFEASFLALNTTCDLPLACEPYGICTLSGACSCIRFVTRDVMNSGCSNGSAYGGFCGRNEVEMIELEGVISVLRSTAPPVKAHVNKGKCADLCVDDCDCFAALYSSLEECFLYGLVRGVKQVGWGVGSGYMVKVLKGSDGHGRGKDSGLKKWKLVVVGVGDGFIIVLVLGGIGYCVIQKRRKNLGDAITDTTT